VDEVIPAKSAKSLDIAAGAADVVAAVGDEIKPNADVEADAGDKAG
jgi:hypothetical protein